MSDDLDPRLQPSAKALRLFKRATRMRLQKEALIAAGDEWIVVYMPERFERGYATSVLGYATSPKRSTIHSPTSSYRTLPGDATSEPLTYDEKKLNLQGHTDPLVWTGRLRQLVFEQARTTAAGQQGTEDTVRGRISFGRLAVGGGGRWYSLSSPGVPEVIRRTLVGPGGLPVAERYAIATWYRQHLVDRLNGITPGAKRPPAPPPVQADRRAQIDAARAARLASAMTARGAVQRFVANRRADLATKRANWRADAGGSAQLGTPARTATERREAHRVQARLSYYRRRAAVLTRRRARYRQLHTTHARAARAALGLT